MTKKHFEMLARVLADNGDAFKSNTAHVQFVRDLCGELASTNSLFDAPRFIMASMPKWMVGTNKSALWESAATKAHLATLRDSERIGRAISGDIS